MTVSDTKKPSAVYLRPAPKSREIRYIESIEEAAMIVDAKHAIAMYTSKSVPNQGPPGTPGTPGVDGVIPDILDTIIASASDELTPLTVDLVVAKTHFRAPYPFDMTNGYVRISLTTAPTGASLIVDVKMNGTSIFTTKVSCDIGEKTSVTSSIPAVLNIPGNLVPDDAEFTVFVTQVGSTVAGTGLKVAITGKKIEI